MCALFMNFDSRKLIAIFDTLLFSSYIKLQLQTPLNFNLQPETLSNDKLYLLPLKADDFELLYKAASDKEIWEQHPTPTRYLRDVFLNYFNGAVESKGAFVIFDKNTLNAIGSTRFYEYDPAAGSVLIGYTFLVKSCWGKSYNKSLKKLMLDYAFRFVDTVNFHVGANNIRSQKAMEKLGAVKTGEADIAYAGEQHNRNFIYTMNRNLWLNINSKTTV